MIDIYKIQHEFQISKFKILSIVWNRYVEVYHFLDYMNYDILWYISSITKCMFLYIISIDSICSRRPHYQSEFVIFCNNFACHPFEEPKWTGHTKEPFNLFLNDFFVIKVNCSTFDLQTRWPLQNCSTNFDTHNVFHQHNYFLLCIFIFTYFLKTWS